MEERAMGAGIAKAGRAAALAWLLAAALPAQALTVEGVTLQDSVQVDGQSLSLNGAGLRSKFGLVGVYVAGLYLPKKTHDPKAIVQMQEPRRIVMKMVRGIGSDTMAKAFNEGVQRNLSAQELAALQPKLDQLDQSFAKVKELKEGDEIDLDFGADGVTTASYNGQTMNAIPGADLSAALLNIWLGKNPVQDDLKKKLLGAS
jgi:hypothetical protein